MQITNLLLFFCCFFSWRPLIRLLLLVQARSLRAEAALHLVENWHARRRSDSDGTRRRVGWNKKHGKPNWFLADTYIYNLYLHKWCCWLFQNRSPCVVNCCTTPSWTETLRSTLRTRRRTRKLGSTKESSLPSSQLTKEASTSHAACGRNSSRFVHCSSLNRSITQIDKLDHWKWQWQTRAA